MTQSLAKVLVHIVFSTKNRERILDDSVREALHSFIGGIVAHNHGTLLDAGSVDDHIHLLVAHPRTCAPARLVEQIKSGSSRWLKTRAQRYARFHWQGGYGLFSISQSHREALARYIANQAEHHRKVSFEDEFRQLLRKYGLEWDERYVWD